MFTEKMGALNSSETMIQVQCSRHMLVRILPISTQQQADRQRQYALDKLQVYSSSHPFPMRY